MQADSADTVDLSGMLVAGKYRITRRIGAGGMGTVWEGWHEGLGTRVAIKFVRPGFAGNQEVRARFAIEARAASMLSSRHAVKVYDFGLTDEGLPFIVMEYLEGETLSDKLTRDGPMSSREGARVVLETARALSNAHAAGVVHRDLKPDNIFLARNVDRESVPGAAFADGPLPYVVKVVDFGIAKIVQGDAPFDVGADGDALRGPTATGAVVGTPHFMSPEQLTVGGAPAPTSDVWSLGACAFTAFTARLPFEGDVLGDIVLKVCSAPLPIPSRFNPNVPDGFDAFFHRACSRDPARRFRTAQELADALALICGVDPRRARPVDDDQVRYVFRPSVPTGSDLAAALQLDVSPAPAMSARTALFAGLLLGVTLVVAVLGAFVWRDKLLPTPTTRDEATEGAALEDAAAPTTRSSKPKSDATLRR